MIDLRNFLDDFIDRLKDFLIENTKRTVIICSSLIFVIVLLLIAIYCSSKSNDNKGGEVPGKKLELLEELIVPDGPSVPDEYISSRKTEDKWSEEEFSEWFTVPDESEIKKLGESNDKMIDEVIGAAP